MHLKKWAWITIAVLVSIVLAGILNINISISQNGISITQSLIR